MTQHFCQFCLQSIDLKSKFISRRMECGRPGNGIQTVHEIVLSCIVEGRGEKKKASETRFLALPQYMPGLALALLAREDGVGPDSAVSAGLDPLPPLIEGKLTTGKFLKQYLYCLWIIASFPHWIDVSWDLFRIIMYSRPQAVLAWPGDVAEMAAIN